MLPAPHITIDISIDISKYKPTKYYSSNVSRLYLYVYDCYFSIPTICI